jgi:hypothetical protein
MLSLIQVRKYRFCISIIPNLLIVQTDWDVERSSDQVKRLKIVGDYEKRVNDEVARLQNRFQSGQGKQHSDEPAVVLDRFGRIMVWHLPGILSDTRIVSIHCFHR